MGRILESGHLPEVFHDNSARSGQCECIGFRERYGRSNLSCADSDRWCDEFRSYREKSGGERDTEGTGATIVGFAPTGSGVIGQTQGTAGSVAILGSATGTGSGTASGVRGNSVPDNGIGVVGSATGANGIGVWGQTTGSGGLGGYFATFRRKYSGGCR